MDNNNNIIFRDLLFRKKKKKGKFTLVEPPVAVYPVGDTHVHLSMFKDPAFALARASINNIAIMGCIFDPISDGEVLFKNWEKWRKEAVIIMQNELNCPHATENDLSEMFIELGVHPHGSCDWNIEFEKHFTQLARDFRVKSIGEIGLDYHYDFSTHDEQIYVFERQLEIAKNLGYPVCLHIREAHKQALEIIKTSGISGENLLLHCCSLSPEGIKPWIELDCYIAYGGILTFKKLEEARDGAKLVPLNRLLIETDSPYMTPEPMRGICCTPDHALYTAACLADVRGFTIANPAKCEEFYRILYDNTKRFFDLD